MIGLPTIIQIRQKLATTNMPWLFFRLHTHTRYPSLDTDRRMRGDRGAAREGVQGSTAEPPACAGDRWRVGGRFWALATDDEEDAEDDGAEPPVESPPSPSPSDLICEFFNSGYSEEEVATTVDRVVPPEDLARAGLQAGDKVEIIRRIVHRKTSASALRPWKGPIPKVIFRATTLIRSWSLLTPTEARERLVTGAIRWETVARDIFSRFGWRSCNRIGN
ncbi:uncharacterized protein [Triticum aestivum]|uniref:uncharacterized protein n=1 Tax=Triticum aestivum TaxID=4565 RepID=UPI001D00DBDD|nr:uncharacterized protein LOC123159249 [Triticum aestivum]